MRRTLMELEQRTHVVQFPLWLKIAFGEVVVAPYPFGQCNPRITAYQVRTNIEGKACARARTRLAWGDALERPAPLGLAFCGGKMPPAGRAVVLAHCWPLQYSRPD